MKALEPGQEIDGFRVEDCIHRGGMALLYRVHYADGRAEPFAMVMKVPRMTGGDGAETIVGFEVEWQMLRVLSGPHVPRLVAAGDLERLPYLVMEYIEGQTLEQLMARPGPAAVDQVARTGAALALAVHSLHRQDAVHLDLKPANAVVKADGDVVLLDFGLSCHASYPDLLAEQLRRAVGSPAWMAPEQVVGIRGDPRSDVFAIGVILYQWLTGELPFGEPQTQGGLRQRLWLDPPPPRALRPDLPPWMQEVVLRCLAPEAAQRYPSAAHLAFDLQHPAQVTVGERGQATRGLGLGARLWRWVRAAGLHYQPSPPPQRQIDESPIVMVGVPNEEVSDATLYSLRQAAQRVLGTQRGARLACVTVISPGPAVSVSAANSETEAQRRHLARLRQWAQPLESANEDLQISCHAIESGDVARALLEYARGNRVSIIVLGAATRGLQLQRFIATVPIRVARDAPCSVVLVKQALPFEQLIAYSSPFAPSARDRP